MRFKICCIQNSEELGIAIDAGAHAVGLVGRMPNGPGPIPDDRIRAIAARVPPGVSSFLLTSEIAPTEIIAHHQRTHASTLQLVDYVAIQTYHELRKYLPSVRIVQVVHITDLSALDIALQAAEHVDALLLDSGNPRAAVKTLGGTGNVHDWSISRRIVQEVDIPVFLAGGLRAENVREAIERVGPYGVDICSGVRTEGHLDPRKVDAFVRAIQAG